MWYFRAQQRDLLDENGAEPTCARDRQTAGFASRFAAHDMDVSKERKMKNHDKGIAFEEHCMNLLKKLGFTSVEQTRRSGDQGADILGTYENTRYVFQCKDHQKKQSNRAIQQVIGSKSIYKASRAGVISRAGFTPGAIDLARANYCLPITSSELEAAVEREESFSFLISNCTFPPPLQMEHDYDVIKKYEEVKKLVGHTPRRCDFDATTLYHIKKKYGGLRNLIQSLSDTPFTKRPDDAIIAEEYKRIRQLIGHIPTLEDIVNHTDLSRNCFSSYPFSKLQRECGDRPNIERGINKDQLRDAYRTLQKELGRPPSRKEVNDKCKYRASYYARRWGSWTDFQKEMGRSVNRGVPKRFTKREFIALYSLVNKLLAVYQHGTPPDTWAIRHSLLFDGDRVISQKWRENLFRNAEEFRQVLESDEAQELQRTLDDIIRKYIEGLK